MKSTDRNINNNASVDPVDEEIGSRFKESRNIKD